MGQMSQFDAIAEGMYKADIAGRGNHFKPGKGVLVVDNLSVETTKKTLHLIFLGDFAVESSTPFEGQGPANPPGSSVTFFQDFTGNPDVALPKTKELIFVLTGESKDSLEAQAIERAGKGEKQADGPNAGQPVTGAYLFKKLLEFVTSDAQPLRGMAVGYSTIEITSKKTGTVLTVPEWTALSNTPDEVQARLAKLG